MPDQPTGRKDRLSLLSSVVNQQLGTGIRLLRTEQNIRLLCPFCNGGSSATYADRDSFSIKAVEDGDAALYNCFRCVSFVRGGSL